MIDTEALIRAALHKFRAERRERFVHAGGRGMVTHGPGERVLLLPDGRTVKVTTCDADSTTQIEENDRLHAVVRPAPLSLDTMTPEDRDRMTAALERITRKGSPTW